jgi:hypothetical protein
MLKKNLAYRLHLKFSPELPLRQAYSNAASISGLFAVLMHKPCFPETFPVIRNEALSATPVALSHADNAAKHRLAQCGARLV